ncbi:SDR family NAD(P)-dependent oxidoreductase [Alkalimarinus coralli]|uniref:SDR family NAD(P)-dependent oxidoreductase n=1 Tax=Alkalimarinus coralli TaxID=2935863 RepID=UPI00202B4FC6|nr:SDR family NAD(P)-dependent oxidoreductase [Alkalimarinus coralli]
MALETLLSETLGIVRKPILPKVLNKKLTLITGGSSGIGLAVARQIGEAGGTVILVARGLEKLEAAKKEVEALGGTAYIYTCNLSDTDSCKELVEKVLEEHGPIDVLINNAGRSIRRSVNDAYDRLHDFERTMNLNYFGCLQLILGFLPSMRERKKGHIINISSAGCQSNVPRFSAYIASKSALDAFSRCLTNEIAQENVHITTVYMPLVRTPMIAPTKSYDYLPVMSPERAAQLVLKSLVTKQKKVTTPLGSLAELVYDISPTSASTIMNLSYRLEEKIRLHQEKAKKS